jgi:hypothetical protein
MRREVSMKTVTKSIPLIVVALLLAWSASAQAQGFHSRVVVVPRAHIRTPYFFDPFWGPYYPYYGFPYAAFSYENHVTTDVKVQVTPKEAEVYVDGYLAGPVSTVKRFHATPGGHAITVYLNGYRTVTQRVYLAPGSTYTLKTAMEKLAPGETSAPVPAPPPKG